MYFAVRVGQGENSVERQAQVPIETVQQPKDSSALFATLNVGQRRLFSVPVA